MEHFKKMYLHLCKERGVEPLENIVDQVQANGADGPRLDLSGQSLSADTCSVLARALQKDTFFSEVSLSDCMISEEAAEILLTGLFSNTTVKVLDLKGNNLRSTGAEVLGKLLARNKTLRRLVLEWNALGVWDKAFSLFGDGLASNDTLEHLDLRNNQINHKGASELAMALKHNTTLGVLDVRWNSIGLLGGRCLLEALQHNKSIMKLELAGNNIPSDTLKALEQTTGRNTDRQTSLRESCSRTRVLSKEIQMLKQEKGRQLQTLMETIDRQQEEMGLSNRSKSNQIVQLQEALNERKSAVNSLIAKLQMTEAALALSEQKNHNLGELLAKVKAEKEEQKDEQNRERRKEKEDSDAREAKIVSEIQSLTESNIQLKNKVDETEHRCKSQQQQIFSLKQELTNSTADLKLRLAQAEDRLVMEKQRSKQALEDMDHLRQKEVENVNRQLEVSERTLHERILKLEAQRIRLEEMESASRDEAAGRQVRQCLLHEQELSRAKAACVSERAQAEEELGKVRAQVRLEEKEHVSTLEEKLRFLRCSLQEVQLSSTQQKQTISELQAKNSQQSMEMDGLRRRLEELQQELLCKDQEKVLEVSRVRVELQEQIGHLQAERTAQAGLKEKISALEREMKVLSNNHREALLDKDSQMCSLQEKLRLKELEIHRMREDEAHRATYLQNAILTYVQGSPLGKCSSPRK